MVDAWVKAYQNFAPQTLRPPATQTKEEAALAFDLACIRERGATAALQKLNFPNDERVQAAMRSARASAAREAVQADLGPKSHAVIGSSTSGNFQPSLAGAGPEAAAIGFVEAGAGGGAAGSDKVRKRRRTSTQQQQGTAARRFRGSKRGRTTSAAAAADLEQAHETDDQHARRIKLTGQGFTSPTAEAAAHAVASLKRSRDGAGFAASAALRRVTNAAAAEAARAVHDGIEESRRRGVGTLYDEASSQDASPRATLHFATENSGGGGGEGGDDADENEEKDEVENEKEDDGEDESEVEDWAVAGGRAVQAFAAAVTASASASVRTPHTRSAQLLAAGALATAAPPSSTRHRMTWSSASWRNARARSLGAESGDADDEAELTAVAQASPARAPVAWPPATATSSPPPPPLLPGIFSAMASPAFCLPRAAASARDAGSKRAKEDLANSAYASTTVGSAVVATASAASDGSKDTAESSSTD